MNFKSKRSKATDIPKQVKAEVWDRDGGLCIFCGRPGAPNAHVIPRSQGGLGIPDNIVTACAECHRRLDSTLYRKIYLDAAERHLRAVNSTWRRDKCIYRKGVKNEYEHRESKRTETGRDPHCISKSAPIRNTRDGVRKTKNSKRSGDNPSAENAGA